MRLSSIELPMSFYALSEDLQNTTFNIKLIRIANDPINITVKLPPGNYEDRWINSTKAAFIESAMNSALQRVGLGIDGSEQKANINPLLPYIKFTVDPVSGRSVFAFSTEGQPESILDISSVDFIFNVENEGLIDNSIPLMFRLGWQLGFRVGQYSVPISDLNNINGAIISEGVCFINGPQYCFVSINDYNNSSNNFFRAAFSESILSPHILGRINLTKGLQNNSVYKSGQDDNYTDSLNRTREYFGPVDIQRLSIQLLDEFGRIINLNNMDWSFVLSFVCLYD